MSRPAKIQIDLTAIQANYQLAKTLAPDSNVLAVVKADAYGHGASTVANALESHVDMFTVSCLEEAMQLREIGIQKKILLLEGFFSQQELETGVQQNCEFVLHTSQQIDDFLAANMSQPVSVWLKIDTGMHRLGIPLGEAHAMCQRLLESNKVSQLVLLSHFSCADDPNNDYSRGQLTRFKNCVASIPPEFKSKLMTSMANSAGILAWPESRMDWNRPGIMLYGLSPFQQTHPEADKLIPAMTFSSEIIALRDIQAGSSVGYGNTWTAQRPSKIATVAVGYGDGYPRNAKSGTPVLVNGQRMPLVGRVSMDLISIDVTDLAEVKLGDLVILWGKDLNANEVAGWADTIGYELVTRMPNRVRPTYIM